MKSKFAEKNIMTVVTLLIVSVLWCNADDKLAGVYSNRAEGFAGAVFILSENGYGMFGTGCANAPAKWEKQKINGVDCIVMTLYDIMQTQVLREHHVLLMIESKTHSLTVIAEAATPEETAKILEGGLPDEEELKEKRLYFVSGDIPEEYKTAFEKMPEKLAQAKLNAERQAKAKRKHEERLRAEQPRVEECLQMIRDNPACIFDFELTFWKVGEQNKVKQTPECRAITAAFSDKSIPFTEEILLKFLDKYKWDEVFYLIGPIFTRDELSEASRRKLHPKVIDYGKRLNYDWGGAFYEHPNTPLDLVKDAHSRKDIPKGFREYLDKRLEAEKK